jgi:hypothetical protein
VRVQPSSLSWAGIVAKEMMGGQTAPEVEAIMRSDALTMYISATEIPMVIPAVWPDSAAISGHLKVGIISIPH